MSHWQFLEATLGKDVVRYEIQRYNLPNRNRARNLFRKCLSQIKSFHESEKDAVLVYGRTSARCRHTIAQLLAGPCLSQKINYANHVYRVLDEEIQRDACELEMARRRSKFDAAIRPHDINGICRYQVRKEWGSQGRPTISAEWIRELVANKHVQFKFEDLSAFYQLVADKERGVPRLYHVPVLNCAHGCGAYSR